MNSNITRGRRPAAPNSSSSTYTAKSSKGMAGPAKLAVPCADSKSITYNRSQAGNGGKECSTEKSELTAY